MARFALQGTAPFHTLARNDATVVAACTDSLQVYNATNVTHPAHTTAVALPDGRCISRFRFTGADTGVVGCTFTRDDDTGSREAYSATLATDTTELTLASTTFTEFTVSGDTVHFGGADHASDLHVVTRFGTTSSRSSHTDVDISVESMATMSDGSVLITGYDTDNVYKMVKVYMLSLSGSPLVSINVVTNGLEKEAMLRVHDNLVFVLNTDRLTIMQVDTTAKPTVLSTTTFPGARFSSGLVFNGNTLFATEDGSNTILAIDFSDTRLPLLRQVANIEARPVDLLVVRNYLYALTENGTIIVFDGLYDGTATTSPETAVPKTATPTTDPPATRSPPTPSPTASPTALPPTSQPTAIPTVPSAAPITSSPRTSSPATSVPTTQPPDTIGPTAEPQAVLFETLSVVSLDTDQHHVDMWGDVVVVLSRRRHVLYVYDIVEGVLALRGSVTMDAACSSGVVITSGGTVALLRCNALGIISVDISAQPTQTDLSLLIEDTSPLITQGNLMYTTTFSNGDFLSIIRVENLQHLTDIELPEAGRFIAISGSIVYSAGLSGVATIDVIRGEVTSFITYGVEMMCYGISIEADTVYTMLGTGVERALQKFSIETDASLSDAGVTRFWRDGGDFTDAFFVSGGHAYFGDEQSRLWVVDISVDSPELMRMVDTKFAPQNVVVWGTLAVVVTKKSVEMISILSGLHAPPPTSLPTASPTTAPTPVPSSVPTLATSSPPSSTPAPSVQSNTLTPTSIPSTSSSPVLTNSPIFTSPSPIETCNSASCRSLGDSEAVCGDNACLCSAGFSSQGKICVADGVNLEDITDTRLVAFFAAACDAWEDGFVELWKAVAVAVLGGEVANIVVSCTTSRDAKVLSEMISVSADVYGVIVGKMLSAQDEITTELSHRYEINEEYKTMSTLGAVEVTVASSECVAEYALSSMMRSGVCIALSCVSGYALDTANQCIRLPPQGTERETEGETGGGINIIIVIALSIFGLCFVCCVATCLVWHCSRKSSADKNDKKTHKTDCLEVEMGHSMDHSTDTNPC